MRNNKNNIILRLKNMIFNIRNITLNYRILMLYFKNIILYLEILILKLEILISHLTERVKILILRSKNITLSSRIITFSLIILILSLVNIISISTYVYDVSALSYKSNVGVGFTFNPTLSINISSSDLVISNLTPGTAEDSNAINVSVSTNAAYGYNLSATVGSNVHNNSNLTHTNKTNIFSSISTNTNLPNLESSEDNNIWGYSYKLSNDNSWSNYSGLPLYSSGSSKTLVDRYAESEDTINFKIGAKASSIQPSGIYSNIINFNVVSYASPMTLADSYAYFGKELYHGYYTMQDMTTRICQTTEAPSELQVIDIRDDKVYWIAKLADGNCWMTQNLDLDLSSSVALTSETSDIDPESYGNTIYTADTGYSRDEETGVVSWLPSTIDESGTQRADTIDMAWNNNNTSATVPGWTDNSNKPYSANAGSRYRHTNTSSYAENNYTSLESCAAANDNDVSGCQHSHFGNYYNWSAAVASNDTTKSSGDQQNSICPKNWSLPANGKYDTMLSAQGVTTNYNPNGFKKIRITPLYFSLFGRIGGGSLIFLGAYSYYWLNVGEINSARGLVFNNANINPNNSGLSKSHGYSVRCIAH